jgi:hypothetical protein
MAFTITFLNLFFFFIVLVGPLLIFLAIVIIGLGQLVGRIEQWKSFDSAYWSFITATTVGYGDIRPLKKVSRTLSIFIALVGLMFTGIIVAVTVNTVRIAMDKQIEPETIEHIQETIERD